MNQKDIFKLCKEQGCCDSCCLRFIGIKNYNSYENVKTFCAKFHDKPTNDQNKQPDTEQKSSSSDATVTSHTDDKSTQSVTKNEALNQNDVEMDAEDESNKNDVEMVTEAANGNGEDVNNGTGSPQAKRRKLAVCGTCLGLLEEDGWAESNATVKEVLDKKQSVELQYSTYLNGF
ncbi:uncharacterized protein LOC114359140 [Ostrinia furnacalis]|uniref:uncharacterized protein LOC114359140 n=1 Tax=Ostrinia furnacalis TaxID=93504 RepID=UPI00103C2446|nr:uncharacterized protein LOC114359140 [Ostrinia furnacalis]